MRKLHVVGISGKYHSGKDTYGEMLIKAANATEGLVARQFLFAGELKSFARQYFKWDGNKLPDLRFSAGDPRAPSGAEFTDEHTYLGGRTLLQGLGVLMREQVSRTFWIDRLTRVVLNWAQDYPNQTKIAVITDCRFINEAAWVREAAQIAEAEGYLVQIRREGCDGDGHISETEQYTDAFMRHVNTVIPNNHGLDVLEGVAEGMLSTLLGGELTA